jgi:protein gp37
MSRDSKIEWTGDTWQFVSGCEDASPGCANCYAKRQAHRMGANPNPKISGRYRGLTVLRGNGPQWTGDVRQLPDQLEVPLHRKAPTTFFCNSLSDTFHPDVHSEFIAAALGVMSATPRHTYQLLTKRADRLPEFFAWFAAHRDYGRLGPLGDHAAGTGDIAGRAGDAFNVAWRENRGTDPSWPLNNVWLGVSVENKKHGVPRIRHLQRTPAAVRFLSIEPLLEDVGELDLSGIHWVIVGGESGRNARPCDLMWIRNVVQHCRRAGVPCFVKQLGARPTSYGEALRLTHPKGGDIAEWPQDLRGREMPEVRSW